MAQEEEDATKLALGEFTDRALTFCFFPPARHFFYC